MILACDDPYRAADVFVGQLGWRLVFRTPDASDDRLACVGLGDAEVMLGTTDEQFLAPAAREHRGAGVEVYIRLPAAVDIDTVHARHTAAGVVTQTLRTQQWGERAFHAEIVGYRFLIAQEPATNDIGKA